MKRGESKWTWKTNTIRQTHFWFMLPVELWFFFLSNHRTNKQKNILNSVMFYVKHQSKCFYFVFAVIEINERFLHNKKKRNRRTNPNKIGKDQLVRRRVNWSWNYRKKKHKYRWHALEASVWFWHIFCRLFSPSTDVSKELYRVSLTKNDNLLLIIEWESKKQMEWHGKNLIINKNAT